MKLNLTNINKAFESKVRLGIMSSLMVNSQLDFTTLKNLLELTDGNLSTHAKNLEELGYIVSDKKFVGKKPCTTYSITELGKEAFTQHLNALEDLLNKTLNKI